MNGLVNYLEQMYSECKIPFEVYVNDENIFKTNHDFTINKLVESRFLLGIKHCKIQTEERYKEFLKIFRFCIENRYKEDYNTKEKVIMELLQNSYVSKEKIREIMPVIKEETYLITINLKDKIMEALDILKSIYSTEIIIMKYNNSIILIGRFEDIEDHTSSINETLDVSLGERCYISYCCIEDYESLKSLNDENIYKINLAKKYNLSTRIFSENNLLFEKIVDNLKEDAKESIIAKFNQGLSKLDDDIIKTIEVFFNLNLNLSEASKQLYVHRNTLIYRLDKIQKYTSYDIRKFNDAVLFKIAFSIWKEKK